MSVTFDVIDPETGEAITLLAYRKRGKLFFKRLPKHLRPENASPRRLAHLAKFAEAAASARGMTGLVDGLPPAAAAVQRATSRSPGQLGSPAGENPRRAQARLRELVPDTLQEELYELSKLPTSIRLQDREGAPLSRRKL